MSVQTEVSRHWRFETSKIKVICGWVVYFDYRVSSGPFFGDLRFKTSESKVICGWVVYLDYRVSSGPFFEI